MASSIWAGVGGSFSRLSLFTDVHIAPLHLTTSSPPDFEVLTLFVARHHQGRSLSGCNRGEERSRRDHFIAAALLPSQVSALTLIAVVTLDNVFVVSPLAGIA